MRKIIKIKYFILLIIINSFVLSGIGTVFEKIPIKRFAFIVGSNNGGPDRPKLRYAVEDAKSLSRVLTEMGGVLPEDTVFLTDPKRESFFSELNKLIAKVKKNRPESNRIETIFYYSGHSDENNILIGKEKISYQDFRNKIKNINADVRIAILDSCASGSFNLLKGVKKKSPFLLNKAYDMKGFAFMTSSLSHEPSQESGKLKGSIFTHYLVSGLRGAADMSQDGIITLTEAYQYAYRETLALSQKTMSGPQHPSYDIQMTGKGDVIMTDVRKSSAVLVITKGIFGRIFIHNQDNVLVVEINKPSGRNLEIGLEPGKYRVINISDNNIYESKFILKDAKSFYLRKDQLFVTDKIETVIRGNIPHQSLPEKNQQRVKKINLEVFGGFSMINPKDLNSRINLGEARERFLYDDMIAYYKGLGAFTRVTKNRSGEYKSIKDGIPFGLKLKYQLNSLISLSLGFEYLNKEIISSIQSQYSMDTPGGETYHITRGYSPFTHYIKGFAPMVGIHFGKNIGRLLKIEGFLTGGPLFAECGYVFTYHSTSNSIDKIIVNDYITGSQRLSEEGTGTGINLNAGGQINFNIGRNVGMFIQGMYNFWIVNKVFGPGEDVYNGLATSWEGEWKIKKDSYIEEWGSLEYQWPSNYPEEQEYVIRDFKLDLSGFSFRIGFFFRF